MSIHDVRMAKQPKINSSIYYSWLKYMQANEDDPNSYLSSVSIFFDKYINCSILDIQFDYIEAFANGNMSLKASHRANKLAHIKKILEYVCENYSVKWNFTPDDILKLKPSTEEIAKDKASPEPIIFKDLLKIYKELSNLIHTDDKWMEVYIVFRLMLDYQMNKKVICKINNDTYNLETGEFNYKKVHRKFDSELMEIFKTKGINLLSYSEASIHGRIKLLNTFVNRNVSYEDLQATHKLYSITCPGCGERIRNSINLLGAVKVDILNYDGVILCKDCLESLNDD